MKERIPPLNIHYRPQLLLGLLLGVWLYLFLVLVGPFDAAELSLKIRTRLMMGYSFVFFLSYAVLIPLQNKAYQITGEWRLVHEVAAVALFCLYSLPLCFAYYKTGIVNGTFSFGDFTFMVYLPTIIILLPVILLGRYLLARRVQVDQKEEPGTEMITLLGENKLDILKLAKADLIAIEAANNYVTVFYLLDGELQKKLLRSSLRKTHQTAPWMMQSHRSYLVNWDHFIEWKDGMTLTLTQLSVPVSQKYKSALLTMPVIRP